mgnify:CR=1 FL=1
MIPILMERIHIRRDVPLDCLVHVLGQAICLWVMGGCEQLLDSLALDERVHGIAPELGTLGK